MLYKNTIIKCAIKDDIESLQRHLFKMGYCWVDSGVRHRQLLPNSHSDFFIVILNDDRMIKANNFPKQTQHKVIDCSKFYTKIVRKQKLNKINRVRL